MSNITRFPGAVLSPTRRGMELAFAMCARLEAEPHESVADVYLHDICQLEDEYRRGLPFRNIVLEQLEVARQLGTEVEFGFCAFLSHLATMNALGFTVNGADMDRVLETTAL